MANSAKQRASISTEAPAAEWVSVDSLKPWADNPRKNDGEPVRKVAASIKRFGFGSPIIARKANSEIIAGHTRWKAAKELGLERVPVRFLDLDPADAKLLAIADNRVGEEAEWDNEKLTAILQMANADGQSLDDTGFSEAELSKILSEEIRTDSAATEVEVDDFEFDCTCPKCGFRFNKP